MSEALNVVLQTGQLATGMLHHAAALDTAQSHHEQEVEQAKKLHEKELLNAQLMHKLEMKHNREVHEREMKKARDYHQREVLLSKQGQLMSHYSELERHFVQLDADLVNASKESERDMYDQRNQQLNTLIVSSSVMIAATATLLIEGLPTLPSDTEETILFFFAMFCSLSFALQTVCVVLCIETLRLGSSFMIRRARKMNSELEKNRMKVEKAFDNLRMPMDEDELAQHHLGEGGDATSFIPTAALSSGLYNSTSMGNLGDASAGGPDVANGELSPGPGVEDIEDVVSAREGLLLAGRTAGTNTKVGPGGEGGVPSMQSPNNPPLGVDTSTEMGPPGFGRHPGARDYVNDERKDEHEAAVAREGDTREVSFAGNTVPMSNLTTPSGSKYNSAAPSPKHISEAATVGGEWQQPRASLRVPHPIDTSGSAPAQPRGGNWVVHGHGSYSDQTPYIGAASRSDREESEREAVGSASSVASLSIGRGVGMNFRSRSGSGGSSTASPSGGNSQGGHQDASNSFEKDRDRIEVQWQNIEVRTHKLMRDRYAVNNAFTHKYSSFEAFWAKYCSRSHALAGLTFYCGTAIMLVAIIIWGLAQFNGNFTSTAATVGISIPIGLSIPLSLYYKYDLHTREISADNEWKEREQREEASLFLSRGNPANSSSERSRPKFPRVASSATKASPANSDYRYRSAFNYDRALRAMKNEE